MSQPRQIASLVHNDQARADIFAELDQDRDLPAHVKGLDYVAQRLALTEELSRSAQDHAAILDRIGLRPTYTHNQRAELIAVSVPTPASPLMAVTTAGDPLRDRWDNVFADKTIELPRAAVEARIADLAVDQAERATQTIAAPLQASTRHGAPELPPPPPTQPLAAVR